MFEKRQEDEQWGGGEARDWARLCRDHLRPPLPAHASISRCGVSRWTRGVSLGEEKRVMSRWVLAVKENMGGRKEARGGGRS